MTIDTNPPSAETISHALDLYSELVGLARKHPQVRQLLAGDVVGYGGIAERCTLLGYPVEALTVARWPRRGREAVERIPLPAADGQVSARAPWWFWSATMLPWLQETNRIPKGDS